MTSASRMQRLTGARVFVANEQQKEKGKEQMFREIAQSLPNKPNGNEKRAVQNL